MTAFNQPDNEQNEQAVLVQNEIVEVINRLINEGIDPRVVIAGIGSATAATINSIYGTAAIVPWFDQQANLVRELGRPN